MSTACTLVFSLFQLYLSLPHATPVMVYLLQLVTACYSHFAGSTRYVSIGVARRMRIRSRWNRGVLGVGRVYPQDLYRKSGLARGRQVPSTIVDCVVVRGWSNSHSRYPSSTLISLVLSSANTNADNAHLFGRERCRCLASPTT